VADAPVTVATGVRVDPPLPLRSTDKMKGGHGHKR